MPRLDIGDMRRLAFPTGTRERFAANAWASQRQYFWIMIALGALLFLIGGML